MSNSRPICEAILLVGILGIVSTGFAADKSPFDDAAALWQMRDLKGSEKTSGELLPNGQVEVGVKLEGADLEASLARGGDGYVARFSGGYLTATSEEPIQLTGKQATICLRLRDASGQWKSGLLATADPEDQFANLIYGNGGELFYRWRTTPGWQRIKGMQPPSADSRPRNNTVRRNDRNFNDGVLPICAAVDWFGRRGWHDVVVRFADTVVELYIDGVLID